LIGAAIVTLLLGVLIGDGFDPLERLFGNDQAPAAQQVPWSTHSSTDMPLDDSLYCPDAGSWEAKNQAVSSLSLDGPSEKDYLVMGSRPTVKLTSSGNPTGQIRVCGDDATVVMAGPHLNLRVYFSSFNSRVIVVDPEVAGVDYIDNKKVHVAGGEPVSVLYCGTRSQKDLRPCNSFNF